MASLDRNALDQLIALAKAEDLGAGDITTSLLDLADRRGRFRLVARQEGVFAGREVAEAVCRAYDTGISFEWSETAVDGGVFPGGDVRLARLDGPVRSLLAAERVLLNFLQRLCGIATLTRKYVDTVRDTGCVITDTRKTTPGWRFLEKYAVRCGGGVNHRQGLHDAVLIKDNHLAGIEPARLAHAVFEMLGRITAAATTPQFVEVEADSLLQVEELLKVVGVDIILLDNFTIHDLREAVALRDSFGLKGKVALEASGGITLERVRDVALTGVERISVGALTHSPAAVDLSLEQD